MEDNGLIILEDGKEVNYRIILMVENDEGKKFMVYTKDEKKGNDTISYAALYDEVDNKYKLTSIKEDKDWEFIRDVLNSIQNIEE